MKSTARQTVSIYWQHARKYKRQLWTIYPMMTVAQFCEDFLSPLLVSSILNSLARGDLANLETDKLVYIFGAIILLEAISHLLWNTIVRFFWKTQDKILFDLNMTVFNHLQKMSFNFFSNRFAGSIVSQTNKFVGSFERLSEPLTWNVFKLFISLIFTSIILLPKAPIVVVAILVLAAIFAPTVWYVRKKQIPYTTAWAAAETARTGQLADAITNIIAVKSFANESLETKRMYAKAKDVHERSLATMRINMNQELGTGALQRSIHVSVILLSVILATRGYVEVGTIYLSLTYTMSIMRRLWDLNNTFRHLTRVFGDASDMTKILQIQPEVADPEKPETLIATDGAVNFKNVSFSYDGNHKNSLFRDLSLQIKPGEKIGLVGPSGGGKTSITKLLLRFMDIQSGTIEIDGQDITSASQADVRRAVTYVPQEPLLFHRSISENIAYGKLNASQVEIEDAAKKANAHEFIEKLSDGYKTLVGERGVKLSGGQKQRIALARTMLKDAPILVLDEATSALDSESEVLIQHALWKLMEGRTAIVIAHRLSTIQKMDRIIVLDKGQIVEEGTHQTLIHKKDGLYARLWSHQSGGFLQD